jgi:hypothetical protein
VVYDKQGVIIMRSLLLHSLILLALLLGSGCASRVAMPAPVIAAPTAAALPSIAELDALRAASAGNVNMMNGSVLLTSPDAEKYKDSNPNYDHYHYRLTGNDAEPSWVIFAWGPEWNAGGVPLATPPSVLNRVVFSCDKPVGATGIWIGVADFATGVWHWQPVTATTFPESDWYTERTFDDVVQPVSSGDCMYIAFAVFGEGKIAAPKETPRIDYPEDQP